MGDKMYVENVLHMLSYVEEVFEEISDEDEEKYFSSPIRDLQDNLSDLKQYLEEKG